MEWLKSQFKSLGAFLAFAGIASIVLHFINWNLKILMWIDMWGSTVGWIIRVGLIIAGGILYLLGSRSSGA
ncbi:MAG TPA: hypothetical protein PKY31_08985 [Spirochaetota bacterium]|mgnify:CR=1 FL=1|nr:hypothetical protein [Spirochaetota bacterium]